MAEAGTLVVPVCVWGWPGSGFSIVPAPRFPRALRFAVAWAPTLKIYGITWAFSSPFDPRRHGRSNRYLSAGRLRPLMEVLLATPSWRLKGRDTGQRPIRWLVSGHAMPGTHSAAMDINSGAGKDFTIVWRCRVSPDSTEAFNP